jgi:phage-related baseplate assembly protein
VHLLRERIQLSWAQLNTAGARNAYRFHAKSADTDVLDADAYGPETHNLPGYVDVYVLSRTGDGTAEKTLLEKVDSTLNADEIRPLTDYVTVKSATIANYAVTAELEIPEGPDANTVLNNAIDVLRSYTTLSHRIKTVVPLSAIYASLQQSGVVRVRLISPAADLEAEAGKAPWCTAINVTRREVSSNDG